MLLCHETIQGEWHERKYKSEAKYMLYKFMQNIYNLSKIFSNFNNDCSFFVHNFRAILYLLGLISSLILLTLFEIFFINRNT